MATTSFLCAACRDTLGRLRESGGWTRWGTPEQPNPPFKAFQEAARDRCYICSILWNNSSEHRKAWSDFRAESWEPMQFLIRSAKEGSSIIDFSIGHSSPIEYRGAGGQAEFIMINAKQSEHASKFSFVELAPSTGSTETLDQAFEWHRECLSSHERCGSEHSRAPTRLIDVGDACGLVWKLRITKEDASSSDFSRYMTLSYRWGPNPRILLLSTNIEALRRGKPVSDLPQLFRDFILVARRFGVRYVWIDSMCIIQDFKEDWESEAPQMRSVYGNSLCNVAASGTLDPEDGLFRRRTAVDVYPGFVEAAITAAETRECYYIYDKDYWQRYLTDGSLHARGWVFQELNLAPRVLYFTGSQVLWECTSEHKCEGFRHGVPFHKSLKNADPLLRLTAIDALPSAQMSDELVDLWIDLVVSYSQREFTQPADRLWAFSGIAKRFQEHLSGEYVAGLWRPRLLRLLDWCVLKQKPYQSAVYKAPSWSRASVDGPVHMSYTRTFKDVRYLVDVLDVQVEPSGKDALAGVRRASLKLRAPLLTVKCRPLHAGASVLKLEMMLDSKPPSFNAFPDAVGTDLIHNDEVTLLLLRTQPTAGSNLPGFQKPVDITCLILERVDGAGVCYRRRGSVILNPRHYERGRLDAVYAEIKSREITLL